MKNIALAMMMGLLVFSGCGSLSPADNGKIDVVTSIFPLTDIVNRLGGEMVVSDSLIPPGSSPHLYEPSPLDIEKLNNAELVLVVGAGFDDWIRAMMIDSGIDEAKIVDLSEFVTLRKYGVEVVESDEVEDNERGFDPHYWVSPQKVLEFSDDLSNKLKELDADSSGLYENRYESYKSELEILDQEIKDEVEMFVRKDIVTLHDSFGYFAQDYGLNIAAVVEPIGGSESSPKDIENVINKINELDIVAVYSEPQLSKDVLDAIEEDLDIKIGELDPLGGIEARLTYVSIVKYNLLQLKKFLG